MRLLLADNFKVPFPDLGSNGLTNRSKDTKTLHLVLDMLVSTAFQQSQCGRRHVELGDLVFFNNVPIAREAGVSWGSFKHNSGYTKRKWRVNNVGVTSDPADITTAEIDIVVVDVKDVFAGCGSSKQISSCSVHDTLWLSCRSRSI